MSASTREAELFALSNHYRSIIEYVQRMALTRRVIYPASLHRDIYLKLEVTPGAELLHFQPAPISMAPRDGRKQVLLVRDDPDPVIGIFEASRNRWEQCPGHRPVEPYAYVPIGSSAPSESPATVRAADVLMRDLASALKEALGEIDNEIEQRKGSGNGEYWKSLEGISCRAHELLKQVRQTQIERKAEGRE